MLKLRPVLFGDFTNVLDLIRDGCSEHGKTLSGAPDCKPCRVIQFWGPELSQPRGSFDTFSTSSGYVSVPSGQ